jgi:hypothetical protein
MTPDVDGFCSESGVNDLGFAASIIGFSGTGTAWGICLSDWAMGDAAYLK